MSTADKTVSAPRRNTTVIFGIALVVTVGLLALLGLGLIQRSAPALASGNAPAFELKSFEGQDFNLTNLRGKAVVLNFWASWCQPCRDEAPMLQKAWDENKGADLIVLGVDYVDTEPEAKKYLAEFKITYPNGPDLQTRISQAYRITGVPETYFITREGKLLSGTDPNGRAYGNWIGPLTEQALQDRVRRLLAR